MSPHILILAVAATLVGAAPTLLGGALGSAAVLVALGLPLSLATAYLAAPETVTPFLGAYGALAFGGIVAGNVLCALRQERRASLLGGATGIAWAVAFLASLAWSSPAFHAAEFASLAGVVEGRDWTAEVQPKDPAHMRLVPTETARYVAGKVLSFDGAIGSQFSLGDDAGLTPQVVDGRLTYVIPLEFDGLGAWQATKGSPGWVQVSAEDPAAKPSLVLPGNAMPYTSGAWLGANVERVARLAGVREEVVGTRFRLDADHRPHWVLSLAEPLRGSGGTVVTGVAVVDPFTGAVERHGLGDLPAYVDVAYPPDVVQGYLADRGELSGGWWNGVFGKAGLTRPETTRLVSGNGGAPTYATGMTSASDHDDSLVSLVYTDPLTNRSVGYATHGGATESAAVRAADNNPEVRLRHLSATMPQVYNVDGAQTVVMPLVNDVRGFQGVALAEVADVNDVAQGPDVATAVANYRALTTRKGRAAELGRAGDGIAVAGEVARIGNVPGGQDYEIAIAGSGQIYVASSVGSPWLVLTRTGDRVSFSTTPGEAVVKPAADFVNLTAAPGTATSPSGTGK